MPTFSFTNVKIKAIGSCFPKNKVALSSLSGIVEHVALKNFEIREFRRSLPEQTSSDLGYTSAKGILDTFNLAPTAIGALIYISTTPDYRSPATACVLQHRLNIPKDCAAYDVNIGGAGFAYALQVGGALLKGLNTMYALLIIGDTPSKQTSGSDVHAYTYTDAGSAILLEKVSGGLPVKMKSLTFSDQFSTIFLPSGGFRQLEGAGDTLIINHDNVNSFVSKHIMTTIREFVDNQEGLSVYDYVTIPQIPSAVIAPMNKALGLSEGQLLNAYHVNGDARGSSVTLALATLLQSKTSKNRYRILACTFSEGFSVNVLDFYIDHDAILATIESDASFENGAVSHIF